MSLTNKCLATKCAGYPNHCSYCSIVTGIQKDVEKVNVKENEMNLNDITVKVGNQTYRANEAEFTQTYDAYPVLDIHTYLSPYNRVKTSASPELSIKDVIFNPPATIVFWTDNTKTVVKADGENYDPEKGIAMAISKKMLGDNKYEYYNVFKHWLKKWRKQNPLAIEDYFVTGEY